MKRLSLRLSILLLTFAFTTSAGEKVLIRTPKPYDKLVMTIQQLGGTVLYQYKNVDGIAADIPTAALPAIEMIVGADNIAKDEIIPMPATQDPRSGEALEASIEAENIAEATGEDVARWAGEEPNNYLYNGTLTGAATLHASGQIGSGIIIAVIDSGIRPLFPHLTGRVISPGIDLVQGAGEPGGVPIPAISNSNFPHGTQTAGMAAGLNVACFGAPGANRFGTLANYFGQGTFPGTAPCTASQTRIPLTGTAPGALIFPIKIFPSTGAGSPTSRTIAAMDAAITRRQLYEAGDPAGLNIKVVNMSLGGPTLAAGRTLSDAMVDALIANDIVPVISIGNDGFSTMTGGSPGTSMSALTVGAASTAIHERIFRGNFSAPCNTAALTPLLPIPPVAQCAINWRPDSTIQLAEFSSRGPTHDGRVKPDVLANGFASFTQGSGTTATTFSFASGTSFSAPTVAGIAALLRGAVPSASAGQVRNAIIQSANPGLVPTASPIDQGAGFVNAAAALALLQGYVPGAIPTFNFTRNVQANMARAGRTVYEGGLTQTVSLLRPAETAEFAFLVPENTSSLSVTFSNITPELPLASQNIFFTDDLFLRIQSARVHRRDRRVSTFLLAGANQTFVFNRPEGGVWRITPTGDWTNAGRISFDVNIAITQEPWPSYTAKAELNHGDLHTYSINVPLGTSLLEARLEWLNMWGNYAVNDVDVILINPNAVANTACAGINAPELCSISSPVAGTWTVLVNGFSVDTLGTPGKREKYTLRITADGTVLKPN